MNEHMPEELRRLPDETLREFHDAKLLRMHQPRRVGGAELEFFINKKAFDALSAENKAIVRAAGAVAAARAPRRLSFLDRNPPDHTRLRRLAAPAFSPRQVAGYRTTIEKSVDHLLEAAPEDLETHDGRVAVRGAPGRAIAFAEVARVAHLETHRLPADMEPGLEATRFYDPIRGTFAAGSQAAVVEVEAETGVLTIHRYVCVEDTGRVINPLIVEGQVQGAIAQGIGGALHELLLYDEDGQLLTGTFMEYALPVAATIPPLELHHVEEPADNLLRVRGVGEGGTLGPAAVIANAVADALAPLGVEPNELPISPGRLWALVRGRARP